MPFRSPARREAWSTATTFVILAVLVVGAVGSYFAFSAYTPGHKLSSSSSISTSATSTTMVGAYPANESFRFVQAGVSRQGNSVIVNATFRSNLANSNLVNVVAEAYAAQTLNPYGLNQTFCCPLINSSSKAVAASAIAKVDVLPRSQFSGELNFTSLDVSPYLIKLYVTSTDGTPLSPVSNVFVQLTSNGVSGGEAGSDPLFFDQANGLEYVANSGLDTVTVINASSNRIYSTISLPDIIGNLVYYLYDPGNHELYVGAQDSPEIFAIDTETNFIVHELVTSNSDQSISSMVYDPSNGRIFAIDFVYSRVLVFDGLTDKVIANITGIGGVLGGIYDGRNNDVLVTAYNGTTFAIDADSLRIVGKFTSSVSLFLYDSDDGLLYGSSGEVIMAMNASTFQPLESPISFPSQSGSGMFEFYDSSNKDLYFYTGQSFSSTSTSGDLIAVSTVTDTVVATIPVPGLTAGLVEEEPTFLYDPANGNIYATELTNPQNATVGFIVISSASNRIISQAFPKDLPLNDISLDITDGKLFGGFDQWTPRYGDSVLAYDLQTGAIGLIEIGTCQTYGLLP